jgi:HK97 family phage prohead protease
MPFSLNPQKTNPDADAEATARRLIAKYDKQLAAELAASQHIETRAWPRGVERRQYGLEIRAEASGGKRILRGYGAKWGTLSSDLGGFRETLAASCFSKCLARPNRDLAFLFDHSTAMILARESAGTFNVEEDSIGLKFRAELAKTHLADDVFENVKAGNLAGCSFAMIVRDDAWSECDEDPDACDDDDNDRSLRVPLRIVKTADIFEISCVTMPAYSQTSIAAGARSLWPAGVPQGFPLEVRSRLIAYGAGGELTAEEQEDLRIRMRLAAIAATL